MQKNQAKKLDEKRMIYLLFGLCWVVYFATYVGRLNYSAAMAAMIGEGMLTRSRAGTVSMAFFFCYGGGQLVSGILADRASPRRMIALGLGLSGCANLSMGLLGTPAAMAACWGLNGFAQSMIWPPIVRIFSEYLLTPERMRCCIHISSTMAAGTMASYLLSATILRFSRWQLAFFAPGALLLLLVILWLWAFRRVERYAAVNGVEDPEDAPLAAQPEHHIPLAHFLLGTGLVFLLFPALIHGVLKDGVTAWVPTYISETFQTAPEAAILVTTLLPVVNLSGAYAASFVNVRLKNPVFSAFVFFALASLALALLWRLGSLHILLTVLLLAVITSSMLAVNTLLVNLVPMYFRLAGKASTVSGLLNSTAYLGSAVSTFTIGVLVERRGWSATILGWLVITLFACASCFLTRKRTLGYIP